MPFATTIGVLKRALRASPAAQAPRSVSRGSPEGTEPPSEPPQRPPLPREVLAHLALPPEAERALRSIGMPADDNSRLYGGKLRAPDTPAEAATRFLAWLRAVNELGPHTSQRLEMLFWEFCEVDHRAPAAPNYMLGALKRLPGVRKDQIGSRMRWIIKPEVAAVRAKPKRQAKGGGKKRRRAKPAAAQVVRLPRAA